MGTQFVSNTHPNAAAAIERKHAEDAGDLDYGDEASLPLDDGRELRVPAFPAPCDYVRVVQDGQETAYWCSDEWRDAPEEVMGAIFGAALAGRVEGLPS